jgi:hypothetical protein
VAGKSDAKSSSEHSAAPAARRRKGSRWKKAGAALLVLTILLIAARLALPTWVRWYVNRTIDKNPLYDGRIGSVEIHLLRGGYTINDVRLDKTTGNVPVPFFSARKVHFQMEWRALLARKFVGRIFMEDPQINFVDSSDGEADQTGGGGPWLDIIRDLFPFKINSAVVRNGSIHFRAFDTDPPVDVYLSNVDGSIENLTNIHDEVNPMISTVEARGLAMGQAKFEYKMKLNPFSYRPTFQLAVRLVGLDVTQVNSLSRAYGQFDFEHGYFDLVVELNAKEGEIEGYVKPLFRNVQVLSLKKDIQQDNVLQFFWEALVGLTTEVLKNQPRDQFGTLVPLRGSFEGPRTDLFATIGNVLRNAFIRAYLPRFEGTAPDVEGLEFGKAEPLDSTALSQDK